MSVYCCPTSGDSTSPLMFVKGAPEGILDRCTFVRVNGTDRQTLTPEIRQQILDVVKQYGTGRHGNSSKHGHSCYLCPIGQDTLRCLALATVEQPGKKEEMNLEDAKNFVQYEVCLTSISVRGD